MTLADVRARLRRVGVPWWMVALVAVAVYANAVANGFAYDDVFIILQNTRVHDLADQRSIWTTPYWPSMGSELGLWRPVPIFAYAVQWALAGNAPWFFHLVSALMHAGVAVLALLLLRRFAAPLAAGLGALVFAVHPVHVEAVANVVGQAEIIAAGAVLGALLIHLGRPAPGMGWGRRLAVLALYGVGLLAKESAVTLPALLVLVDVADGRVRPERRSVAAYARAMAAPLLLMALLVGFYLVARVSVLGNLTGVDAAPALPYLHETGPRLLSAFRAWPEYVRLLFFPADLVVDYGPGVILPTLTWTPMAALGALLLALAVTLAALTPWRPRVGLPAAWFLLTVLTVSNLFFPIGVLLAERTLYLPVLAVSFLVAFGWEAVARGRVRMGRRWAAAALAVALVLLAVRTVRRNPAWNSTMDVALTLAHEHPESYRAQWMMAWEMERRGFVDRAGGHFQLALALWPHDSQMRSDVGLFHTRQGNFEEAIRHLRGAAEQHPYVGRPWTLLAFAYVGAERWEEALAALERSWRLQGTDALTYNLFRARTYEGLGQWGRAAAAWRLVRPLPGGEGWLYAAFEARALARAGHAEAALAALNQAVASAGEPAAGANLEAVAAAVRQGCYAPVGSPERPPGPCVDPVGGWSLLGGGAVPDPATGLQNATS